MKAGLSIRSVYANIIILIATMAISGCIPVPVVKYTGAKPWTIQAGSTSKAEIINKFGLPKSKTADGRFFLYNYSKKAELCLLYYYHADCGLFLSNKKGRVLIEFDNDNIVERHAVYACKEPPDPLCDHSGIDAMWTMINQLLGKNVAAQYGQTLDEFRRAVALRNSRAEALVEAVKLADLEAVKRLIDEGADVNAENQAGYTPLLAAASDGQVVIAKVLLSNGADVNKHNQHGRTLLHEASWNGHVSAAELLLANGAEVNARDSKRATPLHGAVRRTHVAVVKLLLAKGAGVNARDSSGATPLHRAVAKSHVAIIKLLLTKGADLNARDRRGDMPLHRAIRIGDTTVVQLLLTHGADANAKDKARRYRPVKIARDLGGRENIIELLRQHGGKD